jgi:hypothetical protein
MIGAGDAARAGGHRFKAEGGTNVPFSTENEDDAVAVDDGANKSPDMHTCVYY